MSEESDNFQITAQGVRISPVVKRLFPTLVEMDNDGQEAYLAKMLAPCAPPDLKDHEGVVLKKAEIESNRQVIQPGLVPRPFDYGLVQGQELRDPHHSACLETKTRSLVGMGFKTEATEDALDPLCEISALDTLNAVAEDFWEVGVGYLEVVRGKDGKTIQGIYHIPAGDVWVYLEDENARNYHYVIANDHVFGADSVFRTRFARFGDRERFATSGYAPDGGFSEVIKFRYPSSKSRWYSYPGWLSALPRIEVATEAVQFQHTFFLNGGVPEVLISILKAKLDKKDWNEVKQTFQAGSGPGNQHRSAAFNFPQPEIEVQVDRLAMDAVADPIQFAKTLEGTSVAIVTAHRVPPVIAGIQITGKMGAANEMPNAILAFDTLVISPQRRTFEKTFKRTLGQELKLDYTLVKLTDVMDLAIMDTQSRMRTPQAAGRDPAEGLRD